MASCIQGLSQPLRSAHLSADPAAANAEHLSLNQSLPYRVCDVTHWGQKGCS